MDAIDTRIVRLNGAPSRNGPVLYWMSRDQRIADNRALVHAQTLALERRMPLITAFCLSKGYPGATVPQFGFMLRGLRETARSASALNIPFVLLAGDPVEEIAAFVSRHGVGTVVTDFDPIRIKREWRTKAATQFQVPLIEVDAHNVVPCRSASDKREYSAATLRRKINRVLDRYLVDIPCIERHPYVFAADIPEPDWDTATRYAGANADNVPAHVDMPVPGERAALDTLRRFIDERLHWYGLRNDPNSFAVSGLSPYLHFGSLSAERAALEVMHAPDGDSDAARSFIEELIVRRELADNFCWYEPRYDSLDAAPAWALRTLDEHREDPREYVYDYGAFERAETHDPLWNAAQTEMVMTGSMHGYLRMYWAKKILEWSESPEEALKTAISINDRWELDGRDPNGYVGCLWSIAGLHDRPWGGRPVFGSVRYMSYDGCRRKFDVKRYIERIEALKKQ